MIEFEYCKQQHSTMPFKKGESGNPKGRSRGVPNKNKQEFKIALNNMLEYAAPRMVGWLDKIAEDKIDKETGEVIREGNPEKALETISKFIEYIHPKLARSDVSNQFLDKDGNGANPPTTEVIFVDSKATETNSDT